jgi:uncharacterized protein YkwD
VARSRLILLAALSTICLCLFFAGLATATSGARRHHVRRPTSCAKRSSFHASGGHARRPRAGRCAKRRSSKRHATRAHRRQPHRHAKAPVHHPARRRVSSHSSPAAAKSDTCPDANLTPDQGNLDSIRAATLCLVNRERADQGENPLQANAQLQQAAQGHSENMVTDDYFEHVGPNGDTPLSRMRAANYIYSSQIGYEVGENIGWGTLWLATPNAIVAAWMASPGHRANILDARFRDTAIGVSPHAPPSLAHGQNGAIYTQDFGVIITG